MTREQAKQVLISMGIEEPSDEQVSKYLDSVTGEVKKEKDKNASLQEKANKAADLEKELEELKQQNMTDAEKQEAERKKEKEAVDKELADLKAALAESNKKALTSEITSAFTAAGLSTETYATAIKAFASMPADKPEDVMNEVKAFVDGISTENKTALETAKAAWEKEALEKTPNPGGGTNDGKKEGKSKAEEYFEKYLPSKETGSKTIGTNAPVDYL